MGNGLWQIVHYWSIGVEEQFYLFWPWVVRKARKKILPIAAAIAVVWLCCKWGSYLFIGKTFVYRFFGVTRFHCMMLGAIGAILLYRKNKQFIKITTNRWITTIAWLLFLGSGFYSELIPSPCRAEFFALISLIMIMSQVATKPFIFNLENRMFDFIGKISYGIYVIHPMLIYILALLYEKCQIALPTSIQIVIIYAVVTTITIIMAWLSYRFYESPFLKLKNRFAVVKSRNTKGN